MTELAAPQISSLMEALPGIAAVLRSPVATAMVDMARAGAGLKEFRIEDAEELFRFGVRRNLLDEEEAERVLAEIRVVVGPSKPTPKAAAAKKSPVPAKPAVPAPRPLPSPSPLSATKVAVRPAVPPAPTKPVASKPVAAKAVPVKKTAGEAKKAPSAPARKSAPVSVAKKVAPASKAVAKKAPAKPAPKAKAAPAKRPKAVPPAKKAVPTKKAARKKR